MFTVCPKCSLKLVVTAADLRVAQGYVRCGRCSNVFNALVGLSDEEQAELSRQEHGVAGPQPEQPLEAAAAPSSVEPKPEPESAGLDAPLSDTSLEFDAASTDVSEVFIEARFDDVGSTGQSETIILRGEEEPIGPPAPVAERSRDGAWGAEPQPIEKSLEQTDEFELADLESLLESSGAREGASSAAPGAASVTDAASASAHQSFSQRVPDAQAEDDASVALRTLEMHEAPEPAAREGLAHAALEELETDARRPRSRWILGIGTAVLALLLGAQIVNHYRASVAEVAWLRGPLTAAYAALGEPIAPHWNVRDYQVRQLGAIALPGAPGALTVRASIENTASREQPLPLLRVTVQDRFGNRIAARDVRPQAYLPKASARGGYLGAGERVDAEIAFVDPGPRVVGFEIDACLEDAAGRVSCAHQPSSSR
jgi:predicted Zn finger-like uncharacterized protein